MCKLCWIITLMNWFFLVNQKYTVQCDYSVRKDPAGTIQWRQSFRGWRALRVYSLSFSRHNKNIKMEHFFLYILSRYFIWLHKWKGFNDICVSLKYENEWLIYSFQLCLILYPPRCRETISLRGPVFHRSHGHNLVRPGRQSEVIMVMYLRFAVNAHVHNHRHG